MSKPNSLRYTAEALAARFAFVLFGALPSDVSSAFFGTIARWFGPLLPISRQAEARLRRALPELDAGARRAVIVRMWENLGRLFGEYPHLYAFDVGGRGSRIELVGAEHLDGLRDGASGGFLVSAHFGNWETLLRAADSRGLNLTFVRREANNPGIEKLLRSMRHWNGRAISKGAGGAREMLRALSNGERLLMLADQKMNDGIAVPFLGREAMTAPALARMVIRFGCPVVPARVDRLEGARFRVTVFPPLKFIQTGDKIADTRTITAAVNAVIEGWIRERPDHWLWLHSRWPE